MMLLVNGPSGAFVKFFIKLAFYMWTDILCCYVTLLHTHF